MNTLLYHNPTLVHFHIFTLEEVSKSNNHLACFLSKTPNGIREGIFHQSVTQEENIKNYILPSLDFAAKRDRFGDEPICIQSRIKVEASVYFDQSVVMRYYMTLDEQSRSTPWLTSDTLIQLASICFQEDSNNTHNANENNLKEWRIRFTWTNPLEPENKTAESSSFNNIQQRYKNIITGCDSEQTSDMHYVFLDSGDRLSDTEGVFDSLNDSDIISYISKNMMQEINGLLLLTPYEWDKSRIDPSAKNGGDNIALDVDDLIALNENSCLCFPIYGRKRCPNPTNWTDPRREAFHIIWPELLMTLESVLVRRHTITATSDTFRRQTAALMTQRTTSNYVERALEKNANERLYITRAMLHLEQITSPTYRIIAREVTQKFGLEKQMITLDIVMKYVDDALTKISDSKKLQQARKLNIMLALLSSASVLGLLFQQVKPPFIQKVFDVSDHLAESMGILIIASAILIIFTCLVLIFSSNKR